jgi:hypothetical protein
LHFEEGVLAGEYATDKILCVILVTMTLAALQKLLIERKSQEYPFYELQQKPVPERSLEQGT